MQNKITVAKVQIQPRMKRGINFKVYNYVRFNIKCSTGGQELQYLLSTLCFLIT